MRKQFTIPESVWLRDNLRSPLRSILVVFYHRRSKEWKVIFSSYEEVATFTGMGEEKARRSVKELVRRKLLFVERPGVYRLRRGKKNIYLPSSLATATLTYKERAYLSLVWSLIEAQGDGTYAYLPLMDFSRLLGESKDTVRKTINDLTSKELLSKERYGRYLRFKPLFPVIV